MGGFGEDPMDCPIVAAAVQEIESSTTLADAQKNLNKAEYVQQRAEMRYNMLKEKEMPTPQK